MNVLHRPCWSGTFHGRQDGTLCWRGGNELQLQSWCGKLCRSWGNAFHVGNKLRLVLERDIQAQDLNSKQRRGWESLQQSQKRCTPTCALSKSLVELGGRGGERRDEAGEGTAGSFDSYAEQRSRWVFVFFRFSWVAQQSRVRVSHLEEEF